MSESMPFDWSKLPSSKFEDDVWFSMLVPDEISKLRRLLSAIEKWRQIADAEFNEFQAACEQSRTSVWDEYGYDPTQDEAFMLLATERVMFANLAVTIASTAENFLIGVCRFRGLHCERNGNTDLSVALDSLGNSVGQTISDLRGYSGNQRARIIGNCFKHSEGKTNQRFVDKYGGSVGEAIEYENEPWEQLIGDTETLLNEVVSRLKMGSKG